MKEKFSVDDFMTPLESLKQVLKTLEEFHSDKRFEDMDDAFELIERYKKAVSKVEELDTVGVVKEGLEEMN